MKKFAGSFIYINIFLFLTFFIGCSAPEYTKPVARVIEKQRIINNSFDVTWQNAVEWFATHNTPIKNLDKSSGLISTEYSLSVSEAANYMDCGSEETNFSGKIELVNHTGNFNVLIKKVDENSTKVTVNVFFSCIAKVYSQALLSTDYELESSTKVNCESTGVLEKEVLNYLSGK